MVQIVDESDTLRDNQSHQKVERSVRDQETIERRIEFFRMMQSIDRQEGVRDNTLTDGSTPIHIPDAPDAPTLRAPLTRLPRTGRHRRSLRLYASTFQC